MVLYNLTQDLLFPVNQYFSKLYSKDTCGLSYSVAVHNPFEQMIVLQLVVVDKQTNRAIDVLTSRMYGAGTPVLDENNQPILDDDGNPVLKDTYQDAISYFNADGSLTEAGIEWAKAIQVNATQTLEDVVEI